MRELARCVGTMIHAPWAGHKGDASGWAGELRDQPPATLRRPHHRAHRASLQGSDPIAHIRSGARTGPVQAAGLWNRFRSTGSRV